MIDMGQWSLPCALGTCTRCAFEISSTKTQRTIGRIVVEIRSTYITGREEGACLRLKSTRQHKPQLLASMPSTPKRTHWTHPCCNPLFTDESTSYIMERVEGVRKATRPRRRARARTKRNEFSVGLTPKPSIYSSQADISGPYIGDITGA